MDNRYLFRGKRIDNLNKDWVCGHYVSVPRHMIVLAETMQNGSWNCFDIDPATIGQCTGLKDKNGKLIFEGDVVRCSSGCPHKVIFIQEHGGTFFGGMPTFYLSGLKNGYAWTGTEEAIGSVHDNPDLLEQQP